jgi:beta-lactamase class A
MVWPAPGMPIVVCVYTQGGTPSAPQLESTFRDIGLAVAQRLA